jgi:hypothetical protein
MSRDQIDHRSGDYSTERLLTSGNTWWARRSAEPRLDELLEDPIMALLWRSDRLEPEQARATLQALGALIRTRGNPTLTAVA